VARGGVVADGALPHTRVDHARFGGSQSDRAHSRPVKEPVGQVAPGDAGVSRAPDTAACRAEVEGRALLGMTRNCNHPSATVRPYQAPRQLIQEFTHLDRVAGCPVLRLMMFASRQSVLPPLAD